MSAEGALALQKMLFTQLSTLVPGTITAVKDGVAPTGTATPFVIIGNDTPRDISSKSHQEWEIFAEIDCYSDKSSHLENKTVAGAIGDILHHQIFTQDAFTIYGAKLVDEDYLIDEDGKTRRAILEYRFWVTE